MNTPNLLLDKIIYILIFSLTLVAFIDGWAIEKLGFNRLETIYYALILFLFLVRTFYVNINKSLVTYLAVFLFSILTGIFINGLDEARLISDVRYFLRAYLIGALTFYFFYSDRAFSEDRLVLFLKIQWYLITLFVLMHFFFGVGGVTKANGEMRSIFSSYFKEGNVIAFLYLVSWFSSYVYERKKIFRYTFMFITLFVMALLSSKAAIFTVLLLTIFYWLTKYKRGSSKRKLMVNVSLWGTLLLIPAFFNVIMAGMVWVVVRISPDAGVILYWLEKRDVLTVLTSTRNLRVETLFNDLLTYDISELLFGIGMSEVLTSHKLIESDFFDIFQAFGIFGLMMFFMPVVIVFLVLKGKRKIYMQAPEFYVFSLGTMYALLTVSTATGHILVTPMTMILLGVIIGLLVKKQRYRNPVNMGFDLKKTGVTKVKREDT